MASLVNSIKHSKKNEYQSFSNTSKKCKWREFFQTNIMRPALPWHQNQTRTPQKKKITLTPPKNTNEKNLQKKKTYQQIKLSNTLKWPSTLIYWNLFQGFKDGSTSANQSMQYTTLTEQKIKITIISVNPEKVFDKIQHRSIRKTFN